MTMREEIVLPPLPTLGYYYHYKHDPAGLVNNYAYRVMGVIHHTEDDCRPIDRLMVVYRPLYDAYVYTLGKGLISDGRPLEMFMSTVEKDGIVMPRFNFITDAAVIAELSRIHDEMYGHVDHA